MMNTFYDKARPGDTVLFGADGDPKFPYSLRTRPTGRIKSICRDANETTAHIETSTGEVKVTHLSSFAPDEIWEFDQPTFCDIIIREAAVVRRELWEQEARILRRKNEYPLHLSREFWDMAKELDRQFTCSICFELMTQETTTIRNCGHLFHWKCWKDVEAKCNGQVVCPLCRE